MICDIDAIETLAFFVNEAVALKNISAFQAHCDKVGLSLRPHIKTHKSIRLAKAQLDAVAVGITCQEIGEAEAMAADGIDDFLITFNILGTPKLERLRTLSDRLAALAVVADSSVVVQGLALAFKHAPKPLRVLVECDTGAGRCGVQSPAAAVELAEEISGKPSLIFGGLMTYPDVGGGADAAQFMSEANGLLDDKALSCPVISSGGSPDMWSAETRGVITEYRIGTYVYNDRSLVVRGTCDWEDCAGEVVATVVSTPAPGRAIVDAGSKVLTSDLLGFPDYGYVCDHPEIRITGLSEEHGILEVDSERPLKVGERIRIVPNHVCVVSNMFDEIWLDCDNKQRVKNPINARGRLT